MSTARQYTNKLLEMVDEGLVDKEQLIRGLVCYMSEYDVQDFMQSEGYLDDEEEQDDETDSEDEESGE